MLGSERLPAREKEHLLDVGLMGEVAGGLLEDDVVKREALAQGPHHLKLVEQVARR